jgi:hypothetical protein
MAFVDRLEAALKARGFEPQIDRAEIYAFEDWWKRIEALIARADTVVFVLSPDAVTSEVALKEIAYAASLNKRFAPIVCRRVTPVQTTSQEAWPEADLGDEILPEMRAAVERRQACALQKGARRIARCGGCYPAFAGVPLPSFIS